jgi:hypothetical protein
MQNTDQLWLLMGSVTSIKDGRRYIPVHDLCSSLSSITCEILPAVHALTGCDTTSAIFGIGSDNMVDHSSDICRCADRQNSLSELRG